MWGATALPGAGGLGGPGTPGAAGSPGRAGVQPLLPARGVAGAQPGWGLRSHRPGAAVLSVAEGPTVAGGGKLGQRLSRACALCLGLHFCPSDVFMD